MNDRVAQQVLADPLTLLPPPFRWRIFLPLVLVMTAFVLILSMGKIAALLLPVQADIFAPYQSLFPGAAAVEMDRYPCTLYEQTYGASYGARKVMCVLTPEKSVFRRVSIFTSDGKIIGVNFHMRNVRLVDLIWQWGQPDQLYMVNGDYKVVWKRRLNITAAIDRRYSVQAPVGLIVITISATASSNTDK
jgi:hypothetical protein